MAAGGGAPGLAQPSGEASGCTWERRQVGWASRAGREQVKGARDRLPRGWACWWPWGPGPALSEGPEGPAAGWGPGQSRRPWRCFSELRRRGPVTSQKQQDQEGGAGTGS